MDTASIVQLARLGLEGNKSDLMECVKTLAAQSANKRKISLYHELVTLIEQYDNSRTGYHVSGLSNEVITTENVEESELWFPRRLRRRIDRITSLLSDKTLPPELASRFSKVLLYGPPGGGKTTIGLYMAQQLKRPVKYVKVSDVISHRFGETLKNLSALFENAGDDIIFIDEFDAFAKSRYDSNDVGELKRIVNSLIQTIDVLSRDKILIVATNLVETIDPAILRRFPNKLHVGDLTRLERIEFMNFLLKQRAYILFKIKKNEIEFIDEVLQQLDVKTVDGIKNLLDASLINAHLEKKKEIRLKDVVEALLTGGQIDKSVLKDMGQQNHELYENVMTHLTSSLSKVEIAELAGMHRNSLNNYGKEV